MARSGRRRALAARAGLALALVAGVGPARAAPPTPTRLESLLPRDAFAFASIEGGAGGILAAARRAGLDRWLDDPEVAASIPSFAGAWRRALAAMLDPDRSAEARLPARASAVLDALVAVEGQAAAGLLPREGGGEPGLAFLLDFGGGLRAFQAFLARMAESATAEGVRARREAIAGREGWAFEVPGTRARLEVLALGTALLVAEDVGALLAPRPARTTLADDPGFLAARDDVGAEDASWFAWARVPRDPSGASLDTWAGRAERTVRGLAALGLDSAAAAGSTTARGTRDVLVARFAAGDHPLRDAFAGRRVTADAAFRPARGPSLRVDAGVGLGDLWTCAGGLLGGTGREGAARWRGFREEAARALRAEPEDVLSVFRGETTAWIAPSPDGGLVPEAVLLARVRDAASAESTLARATEALAARLTAAGVTTRARALPFAGTTLHVLEAEGPAPTPAWCVADERFLLAPSPHALRGLLARRRDPAPATTPSPDAAHASLLVEADLGRLIAAAWDTAVPLAQSLLAPPSDGGDAGFDPALLPAARTMAPLWGGAQAWLAVDGGRLVLGVRHRWPVLPLLAAGAGVAWAAVAAEARGPTAPARPDVREEAPDAVEATRLALGRFAAAAREYAALQGTLPARAEDLVEHERLLPALPRDGWGRALAWARDAASGAGEVRSPGPDGTLRTQDDLVLAVPAP